MGFFDRRSKSSKGGDFKKQLWDASPQSNCQVCGKKVRGLSGGLVMGSGKDLAAVMESARYVCPKCGFISCPSCLQEHCGTQMERR